MTKGHIVVHGYNDLTHLFRRLNPCFKFKCSVILTKLKNENWFLKKLIYDTVIFQFWLWQNSIFTISKCLYTIVFVGVNADLCTAQWQLQTVGKSVSKSWWEILSSKSYKYDGIFFKWRLYFSPESHVPRDVQRVNRPDPFICVLGI